MKTLTGQQRAVLDLITGAVRQGRPSPTHREITAHFGFASPHAALCHINALVAKGALVSSKPTNKPWGLREFALRTPDGHRVTCGEAI